MTPSRRRIAALVVLLCAATTIAALQEPPRYAIVLLPDTQYYSQRDPARYLAQAREIVRIRDSANIKFVAHHGDVTNNHTEQPLTQWATAVDAHDILDSAKVPTSVIPGNHDMPYAANASDGALSRDMSVFNSFFGHARFEATKSWSGYGGHMPGHQQNKWWTFGSGTQKFLVLGLEFAPTKDAACWADSLVTAKSEYRVIVTTHCYQTHTGARTTSCDKNYYVTGSNGEVLFDELVRRHSNIVMVLSGHINGAAYRRDTTVFGTAVHQVLTDYQHEPDEDSDTKTGQGWMRLMTFVPGSNRVYVEARTVKPGVDEFEATERYPANPDAAFHKHNFAMNLGPLATARHDTSMTHFHDRTVNPFSSGNQSQPAIAPHVNGGSIVVWADDTDDNNVTQIHARAFNARGCERFRIRPVNTVSTGNQKAPSVAANANGDVVIAWQDGRGGDDDIYARGFRADGTELFPEFSVNDADDGNQRNPAVGIDASGRFVVVWEDDRDGNGSYQIHMRGYERDATVRINLDAVNANSDGDQVSPDIAMRPGGQFVVVWEDETSNDNAFEVRARKFSAAGVEDGPELVVSSDDTRFKPTLLRRMRPRVAVTPGGQFVVVWGDDRDDNSWYQIRMRGFRWNGSTVFSDRTANAESDGNQFYPDVGVRSNGEFVVVWQDDRNKNHKYNIRSRRFTENGAGQTSGDGMVNDNTDGNQRIPAVAVVSSPRRYAVVWEDDLNSNGKTEILERALTWPIAAVVRPLLTGTPTPRVP